MARHVVDADAAGDPRQQRHFDTCQSIERDTKDGTVSGDKRMGNNRSLYFEVETEEDGGYSARCLDYDIFTEGDSFEELRANIREVVEAYFFDQPGEYTVQARFIGHDAILIPA